MTLQDLQTVDIPLNKLTLWDENVRTTGAEDGLDELIASITSVGLLHSLVVQKATRGQYSVIAGKRRFLALSQMAACWQRQTHHARSMPSRRSGRRPHRNQPR